MFRTYLISAWRNLTRNKFFAFLNIFGLALSMSLCLVILAHFRDQVSYDNFHNDPARLARIITELKEKDGREYRMASTPLPLAQAVEKNYRGIESITHVYPGGVQKLGNDKKHLSLKTAFADKSLFNIFNFQLTAGAAASALDDPGNMVLSKRAVKKIFGNADPLGLVVHFEKFGDFKVTAVIDDSSRKSHIDFEAYLSFASVSALEKENKLPAMLETWNGWSAGYTYLRLKSGYSTSSLQSAINKITRDLVAASDMKGKENISFEIQPMDKIILGEELQYSIGNVGSIGKTAAELLIGFVILVSACFNYTNLSIARSMKRGREVGVRKVAGAVRSQVFLQFIIESMLNALLALGLAYVLLQFLIEFAPFLAGGISKTLLADDPILITWFLGFSLFTGLLAGVLPAWALSSFKPVQVLKNLSQVKLFGGMGLRKTLIVAQFALALLITMFASVFSRQFEYMANAEPGYQRERMLAVEIQNTDPSFLANQFRQLNGVQRVTAVSKTLGRGASGKTILKSLNEKDRIGIDYFDVDSNFLTVSGLKILAGAGFTKESATAFESEILINESAAKLLATGTNANIVGRQLILDDSVKVMVKGVIKDFHYLGMEFPVWPLILRSRASEFTILQVQTSVQSPFVEKAIEDVWKGVHPAIPFASYWLRDRLREQQSAGDMVSGLGLLAFLATTIAILGLLGMVIYSTQVREKEIGIRKIIGADARSIMVLLTKGFVKLIVVAGLIAVPLAYIGSYFFLNMFATRISPGAAMMLGSFGIMLVLTLIIIGSQVYRVATANPVNSLRSE